MQQPESLTIAIAPLMLIPASIVVWYLASIFKRAEWFAWASILQVSITTTCVTYYLFGTLQNSRPTGMIIGLFTGLVVAYAGKLLYKRSR